MSNVVGFTVPPVVKVVRVPCDAARAFDVFTAGIHRWWPIASHSLTQDAATRVQFEPREGGRLYERSPAGEEHVWGTVSAWEPPDRVAFSWHVGREPDTAQQVEVTFTPMGDETEVKLVHSGWEKLGAEAEANRQGYDNGWELVFMENYAKAASGAANA